MERPTALAAGLRRLHAFARARRPMRGMVLSMVVDSSGWRGVLN